MLAVLLYLWSGPVALILAILAILIATVWFAVSGLSKKAVSQQIFCYNIIIMLHYHHHATLR